MADIKFSCVSLNLQSLSLQNARFLRKICGKMQEKFGNVCVARNFAVPLQCKTKTPNVMKELEIVKEYLKGYLADRKKIFNEKPEEICVLEGESKFWLIRVVHQDEDFNFFSVWTRDEYSTVARLSDFHALADVLKSGGEVRFVAPRYFFC